MHGPKAQNVTTLEKIAHDLEPALPLCVLDQDSGLINGTCGCDRSGLVSVFERCTRRVGCLRGGGASVLMGIEVSPTDAPGLLTNDFVNVVFRDGILSTKLGQLLSKVWARCTAVRAVGCQNVLTRCYILSGAKW